MDVKQAIKERKSEREFSNVPLTPQELGDLYCYGMLIPSAGALYPLTLKVQCSGEGEDPWSVIFIICAEFEKTTVKYGKRGERYVYMEAGHMAQNIQLLATSMGKASYCIGAFDDKKLKRILKLTKEDPVYMIAVGNKRK